MKVKPNDWMNIVCYERTAVFHPYEIKNQCICVGYIKKRACVFVLFYCLDSRNQKVKNQNEHIKVDRQHGFIKVEGGELKCILSQLQNV